MTVEGGAPTCSRSQKRRHVRAKLTRSYGHAPFGYRRTPVPRSDRSNGLVSWNRSSPILDQTRPGITAQKTQKRRLMVQTEGAIQFVGSIRKPFGKRSREQNTQSNKSHDETALQATPKISSCRTPDVANSPHCPLARNLTPCAAPHWRWFRR
jgi:hypothetical protein